MSSGRLGDWWRRTLHGVWGIGALSGALSGAIALGASISLGACGDDLPPPPGELPGPGPGDGEYQPASVGFINLIGGAAGEVHAILRDRPDPLAPELRMRQGVCALYVRPSEAECRPGCGDAICTAPDECSPAAAPISAGDITVSGLRQRLVFRPQPDGYRPESSPPEDLFDSGARIRVSAPGDLAGGFVAELDGVPHLQVAFDRIALRRNKDTRLTWTAAGVGRVAAAILIGRPDAPFSAMLLCETDDYGSLVIPASIASRLPAAMADERSVATVMRLSREIVATPLGPIEVIAGQKVAVDLVRE